MTSPKVSIIVPNYNHAPYLKQRFDSIFNQTFQDFEVIILDDYSTDNSKKIIEEYRNRPQVSHIVYNETNTGSPFKQWAKGFDLARGEYIWIAESDDWSEESFLQELMNIVSQDCSVAVAFSNSNRIHNFDKHLVYDGIESQILTSKIFIERHMFFGTMICNASCAIFKRNLLKKIPNNYTTFKSAGDYLFWFFLCEQGSIAYLNKPLNNFRIHGNNTTLKSESNGLVFKECHQIYEHLKRRNFFTPMSQTLVQDFYLSKINDLHKNGLLEKNCDRQTLLHLWAPNCKGIFRNRSFCFFILLLIKITPFSNYMVQKKPWMYFYLNYEIKGLIWKMLHLPNKLS